MDKKEKKKKEKCSWKAVLLDGYFERLIMLFFVLVTIHSKLFWSTKEL